MKKVLVTAVSLFVLLPLLALPAFALEGAGEVRSTLERLQSNDVSYEWPADIRANADIIGDMAGAIESMPISERLELADIAPDLLGYISALYTINGTDDASIRAALSGDAAPEAESSETENGAVPNIEPPQDDSLAATIIPKVVAAGTARKGALEILASLQAKGIEPDSPEDIIRADGLIGEMMRLVSLYTSAELLLVTKDERIAMTQYFEGFYTSAGYNALSAEGLLSTTRLVFTDDDLDYAPLPTAPNDDIRQSISSEGTAARAYKTTVSSVLSVLAVMALCTAVIVALTLVIKRRDDRKRGW